MGIDRVGRERKAVAIEDRRQDNDQDGDRHYGHTAPRGRGTRVHPASVGPLRQLSWRMLLRPSQLSDRGSASTAPVWLLRRNRSPLAPLSVRALTTSPS